MDKLIHTPDGELVLDDPFRTIGTKVGYLYGARNEITAIGIITKESLEARERYEQRGGTGKPVWIQFKVGEFGDDFFSIGEGEAVVIDDNTNLNWIERNYSVEWQAWREETD